jgi:NAD+--asparagine ADP-ribosyltransferase
MGKDDNICQNIWDKSDVLWEHIGENVGNLGQHKLNIL